MIPEWHSPGYFQFLFKALLESLYSPPESVIEMESAASNKNQEIQKYFL